MFANDYGGGAVNVQDSSTENKPAFGREREGGRKGEEGGRRRKGKSLSTGTEGKESQFQWNKNCAISIRTVCSDRGGSFLSRKWIAVVSSDD